MLEILKENAGDSLRYGQIGNNQNDAGQFQTKDDAEGNDDRDGNLQSPDGESVCPAVFLVKGNVEQWPVKQTEEKDNQQAQDGRQDYLSSRRSQYVSKKIGN